MKRVIVDIDNTLWDFAPVLYSHLREADPAIVPMEFWAEWEFWAKNLDRRTFYRVIHTIHMKQEEYLPFPDAKGFLEGLRRDGFHVTIATHRQPEAAGPTLAWLKKYHLPFDDLHVSQDKSVLFDNSRALVDDSPRTLDKARAAGLVSTGLLMPWNRESGHTLFKGLPGVLVYLEGELGVEKDGGP
jgi:hypothetical protein